MRVMNLSGGGVWAARGRVDAAKWMLFAMLIKVQVAALVDRDDENLRWFQIVVSSRLHGCVEEAFGNLAGKDIATTLTRLEGGAGPERAMNDSKWGRKAVRTRRHIDQLALQVGNEYDADDWVPGPCWTKLW